MTILSQRDPRWADITLGTGKGTIGYYGCTITCLAMIMGLTPDVVNDRMKALPLVNGSTGFANGNLVLWSRLGEAFPDFEFTRVWVYNNDDVLANVPNVLVEVPATAIGGTGKHWVVFIGNQELNDPWIGKPRPTSDFLQYGDPTGYCIVKKKIVEPPPPPSLEGLDKEVGYKPTFEGQTVSVNGVTYKSFTNEQGLYWQVQLPQDTPIATSSVETQPTPPQEPTEPVYTGSAAPVVPQKSLIQLIIDFILKLLGR